LDRALACRRDTAELTSAPVRLRMDAAWTWGGLAHVAGRAEAAVDAYSMAVGLLPVLAWHGLDRATREEHLTGQRGLAADAAALAIAASQPVHAVEVLEQGRSVLWGQVLRLRSDLTALAAQHPDLAAELDAVRNALDRPVRSAGLRPLDGGSTG